MSINLRFLVTGVSGFVGQALLSGISANKHEVVGVSRNSFYLNSTRCFTPTEVYDDALSVMHDCDVIIHLAARVHVMSDKTGNSLEEYLAVNLYDTLRLAEHAVTVGVKRFVFVSSIKVNGDSTGKAAFSESSTPDPQDPYAISKYRAELALLELSESTGMEVVIVRPPLVYGPQVKANFLTLMKIVYQQIPLPLVDVHNKRSLIYVGNLVDALIKCATHPNAAGKTFLVSDGEDVSTPELMRKIAKSFGKPSRIFYFPLLLIRFFAKLAGKKASIDRLTQSLVIDGSAIRKELDWRPPYTMSQGLNATAEWYIENIKAIKR